MPNIKTYSSRSKNRVRGSSPMSRTPSPAVSVITISSESADDNRNQGANRTGGTATSANIPRTGRTNHTTEHYESPPPATTSTSAIPAPIARSVNTNQRQNPSPGFTALPINENLVSSTSNNQRSNHRDYEVIPIKKQLIQS